MTFQAINEGATSNATTINVTSSGQAALTFTSVQITGTNTADFTTTNGCSGSVATMSSCSISVTFAPKHAGPLSETITLNDNAPNSPQVIQVSGTANALVIAVTPPNAAMTTAQTMQFSATGDPAGVTWSVIGVTSGPGAMVPGGAIDGSGNYTPPVGSASFIALVTATGNTDGANIGKASVNVVAPGTFTSTNNVQVAQYSVNLPSPGSASVQFGLDTNYGLTTWTQPGGTFGGPVSIYVAGMKQSTMYHMRGAIQFVDGTSLTEADATFTTGALTAALPPLAAATTAGMTPQSGVELLDVITPVGTAPVMVTDLSANVLWAYSPTLAAGLLPDPIKLLPNGHFLINFSTATGANSFLQEVDLGGNVIWQVTAAQINTALAAATCNECNVTILGTHHDFQVLPNGHLIVLAGMQQTLADGTKPTGDLIIDLGDMENVGGNNPNHVPQPVWAWNEFNHLDRNRRPYSYPDWTHSNALIYSKDDGNLIISIRHQNWLVKVDYNNGAGAGDIIWKMGAVLPTDTGEDVANFTLLNADGSVDNNAEDWFFAQHGPSFTTTNTTGQFGLVLFDNGDDRGVVDVAGGTCGVTGQPECVSTVPVFQIDETAMTAKFLFHPSSPTYSFFGGNAEVLANTDIEFDDCSVPTGGTAIHEVTQANPALPVWSMTITLMNAYRGMRIPSLYPGVQW